MIQLARDRDPPKQLQAVKEVPRSSQYSGRAIAASESRGEAVPWVVITIRPRVPAAGVTGKTMHAAHGGGRGTRVYFVGGEFSPPG
jgi:hypothetical protein